MKRIHLLVSGLLLCCLAFSQNYKMTLGNEVKLKKGTTSLDIISADNTGLYFTEKRVFLKAYFVIGAALGEVGKLYKFDKNFNEVFEHEYKKDLKGVDFHSFQALKDDIFLFATDYSKKEKLFKTFGTRLDKNSGEMTGELMDLGSFELENKRDDYEMKVSPIRGGDNFLLVANMSGKEYISLGVSILDKQFKKVKSSLINLRFEPNQFGLEDVIYTNDNKIVLLGKEFEHTQVGKKKKKRWVFKHYTLLIYSDKGVKEKEIPFNASDKFMIDGKLIETADKELLLAGFYANSSKKDDLNGVFINKVDPAQGQVTLSSLKEIDSKMLGQPVEDAADEDDEIRSERKEEKKARENDDLEELPNKFIIRSVFVNPTDQSIVITAEMSQYRILTSSSSRHISNTNQMEHTTTTTHLFTNEDILIINADKSGNIRWLNALPKSQEERVSRSESAIGGGVGFSNDMESYFAQGGGMPYYSSFKSFMHNNNLVILMNDHESNNVNASYGDKVKKIYNFKKRSNVYAISVDLSTGKMTRKFISANDDETLLMPRHAFVNKNEVYLASWRMQKFGKTKLKFARITVK